MGKAMADGGGKFHASLAGHGAAIVRHRKGGESEILKLTPSTVYIPRNISD
jgi:hypothetical protein